MDLGCEVALFFGLELRAFCKRPRVACEAYRKVILNLLPESLGEKLPSLQSRIVQGVVRQRVNRR